jgi:hypothetical protein
MYSCHASKSPVATSQARPAARSSAPPRHLQADRSGRGHRPCHDTGTAIREPVAVLHLCLISEHPHQARAGFRDTDFLSRLAAKRRVVVSVSSTPLDGEPMRTLQPRAGDRSVSDQRPYPPWRPSCASSETWSCLVANADRSDAVDPSHKRGRKRARTWSLRADSWAYTRIVLESAKVAAGVSRPRLKGHESSPP